jgi:hypothetical protein
MSTSPIIAPLMMAQKQAMNAPAPLGTNISMPGPTPDLGSPALPLVTRPPTQTETDQSRRNQLINSGDGISQIHNPLLRGVPRAADIVGSVFAPNLAMAIPGTMLHHNYLVNQATRNVQNDQSQEQAAAGISDSQAQVQQRQALAQQEQAKAAALANPQRAGDPTKTVQTDDGVFQFNPDTGKYDSRVGDRVEKPKTPEQAAYEAALGQGMQPMEAFTALNQAKNTKDATFQQQFLDAYRKAHPGVSDTDAISATIRATSTEPKIQVINAGAANREAAKNAPLDTSDPAMQQSVNAVANGSMKLQDVFGRGATTAQKAQFAAAVKAVNPNYNSGDHDIENAVRRDFTSGHDSNTLNAVNTAYKHLDTFAEAAKTLNNGNSKSMNELANALGVQFQNGQSPQVISGLVKEALKGEVARALTGAGATVDEQRNIDASFSNANSLQTMLGVANEAKTLLKGKEKTLRDKFDNGQQGKPNFISDAPAATGAATHVYNVKTGKIEAK